MRLKTLVVSLLLALFLLPSMAQKSTEDEKTKLIKYMARLFNADPKSITIESLKSSDLIKGAKEGKVNLGRQAGTFFVIGQKLIIGNLYDLSVDPFAENMKKISLRGRPVQGSGPVVLVEYSDFQ